MPPQQRADDAARLQLESTTAIRGLLFFGSTVGTQLMLAGFALQGLDFACSFMTCAPAGSVGLTPLTVQRQVYSSASPASKANTLGFATFNNLFSGSIQTRQAAANSINSSAGLSGGGSRPPSNSSVWVTPSGAVVTFGGQLVAPPPSKRN
jgi:hypothetical protein